MEAFEPRVREVRLQSDARTSPSLLPREMAERRKLRGASQGHVSNPPQLPSLNRRQERPIATDNDGSLHQM